MGGEKFRIGFTIVELLIVIVVIAILASITIVSYNGIKSSSQSSAVSSGLRQVEKSMRLWLIEDSLTEWPADPIAGGGIPLSQMINDTPNLQKYLQSVPSVQGVQTSEWFYDNEGDTKYECSNTYNGVNIVIRYVISQEIAQKVDDSIDDSDLSCGKVRYADQRIFYSLSYRQAEL
ncbi:MAG: type IV pilin protein [Candidatus Microsaccharimonas sp.]